ncbi:hypothetical protein [Larsenimonas suaedae]|uniref:Uncharacterized protein n=1 Tax=Larsenimonas suaedae TaxID=1851019 RepID=A0ABU1H0T7_9GAMM|nr:hypothetical protein [Larsenimonas suaedae]MCM2973743.1 hypothetical protein [Larsenimonas suaedae]MDR5897267.1 hypothetical protein [Larsenimonas suaedae]
MNEYVLSYTALEGHETEVIIRSDTEMGAVTQAQNHVAGGEGLLESITLMAPAGYELQPCFGWL